MRDFSPFLPQLEAYIAGRLDPAATERLEQQLQNDDALHDYYLSLRLAGYYQNPANLPNVGGPSEQFLDRLRTSLSGTDRNGQSQSTAPKTGATSRTTATAQTGGTGFDEAGQEESPNVVQLPASRFGRWMKPAYALPAVAAAALVAVVLIIDPFAEKGGGPKLAGLRKAGTVTYTDGDVTIDGKPVKRGSRWMRGSKLETGAGSYAVVQFADNAAVTVRPETKLIYLKNKPSGADGHVEGSGAKGQAGKGSAGGKVKGSGKKKGQGKTGPQPEYNLNMESGYLFAKVKKGSSKFQVRTPTMVAAVRGTEFAVHYKEKKGVIYSQLLVHDGKVSAKLRTENPDISDLLNENSKGGPDLSKAQRKKLKNYTGQKSKPVILTGGQKVLTKTRVRKLWQLPGFAKYKNNPEIAGKTVQTGSIRKPRKQGKKDRRLLERLAQIPILPVDKKTGSVRIPSGPGGKSGSGPEGGPDAGAGTLKNVFPKPGKIKRLALGNDGPGKVKAKTKNQVEEYKTEEEILSELKEKFGALTKITTTDGTVYIGGFESQGAKMTVYHVNGKTVIAQKNVKSIEAIKD